MTNPPGATDSVLVSAVARRRPEAIAELHQRHGGALHSMALRLLRSPEMAEEVVQDIFTRLWGRPEAFDASRGSLRSFLMAQAHSRAIDIIRSENARRGRDHRAAGAVRAVYDLESEAVDSAMGCKVREAMASLSEGERRAVSLAYFEGHSYREVASMLGEPEGTVKSRMRSALRRLRTTLTEAGIHSSGDFGWSG